MSLLEIENLNVYYMTNSKKVHAVRNLSLKMEEGEVLGLVGESGSGKSTFGMSLLRILSESAKITADRMVFKRVNSNGESLDSEILKLSETNLRRLRWSHISMIFQSSMNSLNPVARIEDQLTDALFWHGYKKGIINERIDNYLRLAGLPESVRYSYPHELSGGMKQRVAIAMSLICNPELVIADEPTTALDVVVQRKILKLLVESKSKLKLSVIFITHDISLLASLAQRVGVMYAGSLVELAPANELFKNPRHPYSIGLMATIPKLKEVRDELFELPGSPPDMSKEVVGCPFAPRCKHVSQICMSQTPGLREIAPGHMVSCHNVEVIKNGTYN